MSCWSRVDHIEVHEQAGDAGFGRLCPDGFVYNIEVETNHNYFAEGFLVHNCHHTPGRSFRALLESYTGVPRIGLTATPFRLDGKPLGDLFGELVVAAYADDLVREGTLIEPRVYAPPPASLQGVKIRHGDFEQGELARRLDKSKLVGDIVQTWKTHADGRRTVVFAVNVEHSRHIIESFVAAGIPAEHLDGATPRAQRDAALDRLAKGQTLVLSNCCVLTEGWDLPALECAIIARPTASLCLHLQAVGRIMRAAVGKTGAIVLDHAGNFLRHGRVTRRLEYSLSGKVKPQTASIGTGLRTCPGCYRMVLSSRTHCPECGRDFTVASRDRMPETIDGELQEFTGIEPPDMTPPPSVVEQREFFEDLQVEARARGWKPGAVAMRYKERFGEWPTIVEIDGDRHIALPDSGDDVKEAVLEKFRAEADSRGYKPTYALARFKQIFGHWPQRRRKELVA